MKISANHFKRYKEIAQLLWKYGRSDLVGQIDAEGELQLAHAARPNGGASPEQLADDLEAMGPTFVKLGQVLSGRPDLIAAPYVKALVRLQDRVKAFPYAEVERIVESELGVRISKAFSRFDPDPIAGASLGQVHAAALRDGREVVVKVQRPGVARQVADDFEVLAAIAAVLDQHTEVGRRHRFGEMVDELRTSIAHELNYEREAQNLVAMERNLAEFPLIRVPQPVTDYSAQRVLTMEHVSGTRITKLSPAVRTHLPGAQLAAELFRAYLKQVLVDGLFHADPHPGNIFITDDGRIALLDLGMVGHVTPSMQASLFKILMAISRQRPDDAADVGCAISETEPRFDPSLCRTHISQPAVDR